MKSNLATLWYRLHSDVQKTLGLRFGVGEEEFVSWAKSVEIEPVVVDGKVQGVIALSGDRLHVAVTKEAKGRWLKQLQRFIEKQGRPLEALTASEDSQARRFIERTGCKLISEDSNCARYAVHPGDLWFNRRSV